MKKHEHSGCTIKTFDNPKEILILAGIEKSNSMLDVGTGSGYLSLWASEIVGSDAIIYALDSHEASIEALKQELTDKGITNIKPVLADVVQGIPLYRHYCPVVDVIPVKTGIQKLLSTDKTPGFQLSLE